MKNKKNTNEPIGLEESKEKLVSPDTEVISVEDIPQTEDKEHYSFPWFSIIASGVIIILIIACIVLIYVFGGPQ
ncbi:MAG TPA: hypothetical protein PKO28_04830 [Bacilli bacterium]|nr:hypothetical protein [Bacilli bacterium]HPS19310.1 hypothetical protein [Bacilli bacterium]